MTRKRKLEDLDPVEFMAVLDEGGRKFNEECDRLGISRVIEVDGQTVFVPPRRDAHPFAERPCRDGGPLPALQGGVR